MTDRLFRPIVHALRGRSIVFHGMKRSGNHAVQNWIRSGDHFRYDNNILPFQRIYPRGQLDAHTHSLRYPPLGKVTFYNWVWKKRMLISIEDQSITHWLFDAPEPRDILNTLLVRCPINLFSSQIKRAFKGEHAGYPRVMNDITRRTQRLWIEHAREALGETSFLKNKVVVVYDRFIVDAPYRAEIAKQLSIMPDDSVLTRQAQEGRGSSFHSGAAPQLQPASVAELRHRADLLDDQERALLDQMLDDPEIPRLREKLLAFEKR